MYSNQLDYNKLFIALNSTLMPYFYWKYLHIQGPSVLLDN